MYNNRWLNLYSILFIVLSSIVAALSITAIAPPAPVKSNAPKEVFSAQRAFKHVQQVARAPHSIGTTEHERVRNYIINASKQLGLLVQVQNTTVVGKSRKSLVAANVHNIISIIKGTKPGKAVLISAHYDSQPNTPGAADDGMGVAAMLEAARVLKASPPLQRDIIFLYTDGEEEGLYGAKAFIEEHPMSENIGLVMNWDFRGNSGTVINYTTSANNGWLIRQYAKAVKYPVANSMGYEISKRMPNDVDFRYFQNEGITGFTNALLGGYSNYHSMNDNPGNLDLRSLQQVGDNIVSMTKHVGNLQLENTKAPDVSFFNLFGYCFIYYPSSWNIFFIAIATILFLIFIIKGFREKKIRIIGFIMGTIALPVTLTATFFASRFLLKRILRHYPWYRNFYDNTFYNNSWYFATMTMVALLLFSLIYLFITRKWGYFSTFGGILLFDVAAMWLTYLYAPSAIWLLVFPLLFLLGGYGWMLSKKKIDAPQKVGHCLVNFISVVPVLLLFVPLTYLIFLSFGLGNKMPFVSLLVVFIAALCYPVLSSVFKSYKWLMPSLCLAGIIFTLVMANTSAGISKTQPLQTNVRYRLNATDSTAVWLSDLNSTDKFSEKFFPDKKTDTGFRNRNKLIHTAPLINFEPPNISILSDTSYQGRRELTIRCYAVRNDVNNMDITVDDSSLVSIVAIKVNDKDAKTKTGDAPDISNILFYGVPKDGFVLTFILNPGKKLAFELSDKSMGLPQIKGLTDYPEGIIPGPGFNSNTTQVARHFVL